MKKLLFVFAFILISNLSWSQESYVLDVAEIKLKKTGVNGNGITIRATTNETIRHLGQPSKKEDYFFEIDDKMGKLYHYGKNEFYFLDDKLQSFNLYDTLVTVHLKNGRKARIADKLKKESNTNNEMTFLGFPVSAVPGNGFNRNYKTALIFYLSYRNQALDSSLNLLFDDQDGLICIELHH